MGTLSHGGRPTGVIYGFLRRILVYAEKFKTTDFVLCWDSGKSIREDFYPKYKEGRNKKRSESTDWEKAERIEMIRQVHKLRDEIIPYLGFKNSFVQTGFEADDLLAWWADKLNGREVILVTSDNDLYQCLSDNCCLYLPNKKTWFTCRNFIDIYKITPEQWAFAKAIGGCSGDGVIGIKGAADPKNNPNSLTLKYIRGELTKGVVYSRIEDGDEVIARNMKLVELPCPIKQLKRMLKRRNKYSRKAFIKVFDEHRFISMLDNKQFHRWEKAFGIGRERR
jgi:hypothetical protein